jgi:phosphoribosyl 1,2-cyclic phosphodiesterase
MKVKLWGTRGSLAAPGADTARYGGNTSCAEVRGNDGTVIVLDAGTGIRPLGGALPKDLRRVDVLLTHLHMDHIQGLGFFAPLYNPNVEVHIWGPASTMANLRARLMRYLSPPLFPVHLRDLPCRLEVHEVPCGEVEVGEFRIASALVCHPGPTVGYRLTTSRGSLTYLPDHEPALGTRSFPGDPRWTSGYELAAQVDLLIHDAQYSTDEYGKYVGWGHSSVQQALDFAALTMVKHLVLFHHDPGHDDERLDVLLDGTDMTGDYPFRITAAVEGAVFEVNSAGVQARPADGG